MREYPSLRRVAVTSTLGSFSFAALMGILALLGAGEIGVVGAQVLLTTLVVGCASICVLCYVATDGTRWAPVGLAGGVVLVVPVLTSLMLVWTDWFYDHESGMFKIFGIGVVVATTLAQAALLLALAGDRPGLGGLLFPTLMAGAMLAVLISLMIVARGDTGDLWRLIGIVAILDVLGTLVTIALAKFGDREVRDARMPHDGSLYVSLSADQAVAINRLVRSTGRSPEHIVAEAVDRLLYDDSQTAGRSGS